MPTVRVPLVGSFNQRGIDGEAALTLNEDQRFLNCIFDVVTNPVTGKSSVFASKRPGFGMDSLVTAGNPSTGIIKPQAFNASIAAFGDTNSTLYFGSTSIGTITGRALHFTERLISAIPHIHIRSSDGTGWYYVDGAKNVTAYTCDGNNSTTISDIKIAGANDTTGLYIGQKLSAASNIVAGSRIVSINSGAFTAVLDTATTGGAFNDLATTKEPIAKIIDADFVSSGTEHISAFADMDGYAFYSNDDGYVYNMDINSATSQTANSRLAVQQVADPPVGVAVQKNTLIVFGTGSNEKYNNAGYSSGSPLQLQKPQVEHIGALDQRSITSLEDDIYYASSPSEGDVGAYRMRGLASTRISTPTVDRIMGTVSASSGAIYASSFRMGGYPYLSLYLSLASDGPASMRLLESGDFRLLEDGTYRLMEDTPAQSASFVRQLVYNDKLNIWSEWDCSLATYIDSVGSGISNKLVATSRTSTSGKIYRIDPTADGELYQDDGPSFTMQIRTARLDHGTGGRKFIPEIKLICDTQSAGTATLECSDDDYRTWTTLGTFDLTVPEPRITRCGSYVGGRAYRLSHSYNGPFRAEALEITYSLG